MKKNFTPQGKAAKSSSASVHWRWFAASALFAALLSGGVYVTYHQKGALLLYVEHAKGWLADHKVNLNHGMTTVKKIVAKKNQAAPEVHFEFYTALPNMQMKAMEPQIAPVMSDNDKLKTKKTNPIPNTMITSADELEREFSKEFKREINNDL